MAELVQNEIRLEPANFQHMRGAAGTSFVLLRTRHSRETFEPRREGRQVESLHRDPVKIVVGIEIAFSRITDQGDDASGTIVRPHLFKKLQCTEDIGPSSRRISGPERAPATRL